MPTLPHGFLRVAAAVPALKLADPRANAERTLELLRQAADRQVQLAVFPECNLTGYTCNDLFHQATLLRAAEEALARLLKDNRFAGVAVVGLPVGFDGMVFNCAAVIQSGKLLGVVPKSYLPNYKEFYDARYFAPARNAVANTINLAGNAVAFGNDLLFESGDFTFGVEICEDLWMPIPPSSFQAAHGATVLVNLSASNETVGKVAYRRQHVLGQSRRCLAGYLYVSSGPGESTSDLVFGGHAMIAENGSMIAESERFRREAHLTAADLDLDRLQYERRVSTSFHEVHSDNPRPFRRVPFELPKRKIDGSLLRPVAAHPFVPNDPVTLDERCREIFQTQVTALARRLELLGNPAVSIGISGGLDSTLALLVLCKTFDSLSVPRTNARALTMPGFGTSARTKSNAWALMRHLNVNGSEIDIRTMAFEQLRSLGHSPFGINLEAETADSFGEKLKKLPAAASDLTFENVQARVRTSLLMNAGFTLGTGDLSELCLGWCTYNADHMSMYNVNASIPKTLVKFLVKWAAEHEFEGEARQTLLDIVATLISPELLPGAQSTEDAIGPFELHDFFLYHLLRWGATPRKILFLAEHAQFDRPYFPVDVKEWLKLFLKRFFANQFKRNCLPDGPKVGSVSISPRGDWRMPSDAEVDAWIADLES